ncbi:MAG: DUF342 domain-containing protein [Desulfamplus sp.]|nr:DUF342 domain-containing protein [Desulfamplus sp.]
MVDKKCDKILVVESQNSIGESVERLLTGAGYDVRWVKSSYPAIAALEGASTSLFAVVISAYKIPRMNGDELLERARSLSPDTQRMLFSDSSDMEILINAINRAAIHSSIAIPFKDDYLLSEVARLCKQFGQIQKRETLRNLTEHQNRQMYKVALHLKKKREVFKQKIEEKKQQLKILMDSGNIGEFKRAATDIKLFLENIVSATSSDNSIKIADLDELYLLKLLNKEQQESNISDREKEIIDTVLRLFFQNRLSFASNFLHNIEKSQSQEVRLNDNLIASLPIEPVDGSVRYFFEDFHSSGVKPFVLKNSLLAEKTQGKAGTAGVDTFGNPIPVEEPKEPLFTAGVNTRFSDDKLQIFSTADGHPHLDFMGVVSVFPELQIKGDVNYDTGDINFNGNITVDGVVKAGCSVKCANLTAQAVEGAQIHLTGDLNVSAGIIDANIVNIQGNVHAKYINSSRIKALGDIVVQNEIIDSELFVGGRSLNRYGLIVSSFVNSRGGVVAGRVGTAKSLPSKLEVGTEGIIEMMLADLDQRVEKKSDEIKSIKDEILSFESEEKLLNEQISDAVNMQDSAQADLKKVAIQLPQIEASEDIEQVQRMLKMVGELQKRVDNSEKIINQAFERQDTIVEQNLLKQRKIELIEGEIKEIKSKQRGLKEFATKSELKAEVVVNTQIMAQTSIAGSKSKLILKQDLSRCKIYEIIKEQITKKGVNPIYEIVVVPTN